MKQTAKRILSLLLCLALALGAVAVPALAASTLLGDVDGDKTVTTKDARLALRAAIGLDTPSAEAKAAADVTGDLKVQTDDARIILRASIGLMRLTKDGKLYEDIPKPGDVLAEFIMKCGDPYDWVHTLDYVNENGDTITYRYDETTEHFEIDIHEYYEDFEAWYRVEFFKSCSDYYIFVYVFDESITYTRADYKMDPANLNWNTGWECLTEVDYHGDSSTKGDLMKAVSGTMCLVFSLLLEEAPAAGYEITHNDMHLYRLMEPYQG